MSQSCRSLGHMELVTCGLHGPYCCSASICSADSIHIFPVATVKMWSNMATLAPTQHHTNANLLHGPQAQRSCSCFKVGDGTVRRSTTPPCSSLDALTEHFDPSSVSNIPDNVMPEFTNSTQGDLWTQDISKQPYHTGKVNGAFLFLELLDHGLTWVWSVIKLPPLSVETTACSMPWSCGAVYS